MTNVIINDEIYRQTIDKLIAQGGCSVGFGGMCKYNGENGRHCFAGHLVPDHSKPSMEEGSLRDMFNSVGITVSQEEIDFVHSGQCIHDRIALVRNDKAQLSLFKEWAEFAKTHDPAKIRFLLEGFCVEQ